MRWATRSTRCRTSGLTVARNVSCEIVTRAVLPVRWPDSPSGPSHSPRPALRWPSRKCWGRWGRDGTPTPRAAGIESDPEPALPAGQVGFRIDTPSTQQPTARHKRVSTAASADDPTLHRPPTGVGPPSTRFVSIERPKSMVASNSEPGVSHGSRRGARGALLTMEDGQSPLFPPPAVRIVRS